MLIYKFSKIILKNILMRILNPGRDSKTPKLKIMKCVIQTLIFVINLHELNSINYFHTLYQV